jgi:hypothetical protein
MTDTTTIEITVEQRDALKARKKVPRESYQSVMDRLLADDDPADETDADDADEIGERGQEQIESIQQARDEILFAITTHDDYANEEHVGELADLIRSIDTSDRLDKIEQTLEELQSGRY